MTGKVFFKHLKILSFVGRAVMVAAYQRRRLKLMNETVCFFQSPVGIFFVPHAVKPNAGDLAVIRQELRELRVHVVEIFVHVARFLATSPGATCATTWVVIRMMPV